MGKGAELERSNGKTVSGIAGKCKSLPIDLNLFDQGGGAQGGAQGGEWRR